MSRALRFTLLTSTLLIASATTGLTQPPPPAENCDGTESLGGVTLPWGPFGTAPTINDQSNFIVTPDVDNVACFVPSNTCDVRAVCQTSPGLDVNQLWVQYDMGNTCDTGTGISSSASFEDDGEVEQTSTFLTPGQVFCVWCGGSTGDTVSLTLEQVNATDCGVVPVELQTFSIDR